ncbi:MAG: serine protease [Planctomycetota bacterium]|nr:serine protease [Planctomycetota bacterium]
MRMGSIFPWTCAAVGAGLALGTIQIAGFCGRLTILESRPVDDPARVAALERQVEDLSSSLSTSLTAIHDLSRAAMRSRELGRGLLGLEADLRETACRLDEQRAWIARVQVLEDEAGPRAIEERFAEFASSVDARWREVGELASRAQVMADTARTDIQHVEREIEHDPDRLWHDLLGPTVQVSGEETVGTGVMLAGESSTVPGETITYVLTAWHVVRDLYTNPDAPTPEVPVTVYAPGKRTRTEPAHLVEHDADLDVALLRLLTTSRMDGGARLAPREKLGSVRVFERIYAVGCPLGNDPIPTFGEIADVNHVVDGQSYWMISAPTYIGNSGGGIFDAETHELLALFTKIYTHGTVRPMVVPHMGLATPLAAVYDWLDRIGYAALEPTRGEPRTAGAAK